MSIIDTLRKQAQEIADEGHSGWGNTMTEAADTIAALREENERLKAEIKEWESARNHVIDVIHDSTVTFLSRAEAAEKEVERLRALENKMGIGWALVEYEKLDAENAALRSRLAVAEGKVDRVRRTINDPMVCEYQQMRNRLTEDIK